MRSGPVIGFLFAIAIAIGCGASEPAAPDGDATGSGASTAGEGSTGADRSDADATPDGADASATTDAATDGPTDDTTGESPPGDRGPRYDEVQQKSAHNAYQRHEAIVDQLVYHRVRSIELDIHVGKTFEPTIAGRWYVYHSDITDDDTSCRTLDDCLQELVVFAEAVPEHEVVTLWIDLKDDWDAEHRPIDLDAALDAAFGDAIFTPADLRAACPDASDLASVVLDAACGWPSLLTLRGKVIVALTGGGVNSATSRLSTYLDEGARAFAAPNVTASPALSRPHPQVAIYNASHEEISQATVAVAAGFVVRTWGLDAARDWAAAQSADVHHLATDFVNLHRDPWATTHDAEGWPFACIGACASIGPEPAVIGGIEVDSGDIWGSADDFWFAHRDDATAAGDWIALVSTANSHVEPFAKGCLMARVGLAANAPYFAVCRPADEEPLRVQWRAVAGATSQAIEHDIVPSGTVSPTSVAWIRLTLDAGATCATGWGARHRGDWVQIGTHCFDEPLDHRGFAASSHDAGPVRVLFVGSTRDDAPVSPLDLQEVAVGSAQGAAFEGPLP